MEHEIVNVMVVLTSQPLEQESPAIRDIREAETAIRLTTLLDFVEKADWGPGFSIFVHYA